MTIEMKKAFKLIKYSFQFKANCVSGILITLAGIIFLGVSSLGHFATPSSYLLGAFYLILGPTIMVQMLLITLFANIAKSSPRSSVLELRLPDFLSAIIGIAGYTLIVIYSILINQFVQQVYAPSYLLAAGILIAVLLIYNSIAYKLFITSSVGLLIAVFLVFAGFIILIETSLFGSFHLNMWSCCLLGYLIIFISLGLSALLRRAVYKLPLSKLAGGTKLRKQL